MESAAVRQIVKRGQLPGLGGCPRPHFRHSFVDQPRQLPRRRATGLDEPREGLVVRAVQGPGATHVGLEERPRERKRGPGQPVLE